MENKPRYSRVSDILDLATFMATKPLGITITDIAQRYNVSRRTAERMRDSLTCIFPQIDEIETDDIQKHWGFTNFSIYNLISFSPKEIVNLEQLQRRTTNKEMQIELEKSINKIKALNRKNIVSIENKIELFMQTEGYAIRQMPQYKIDITTLDLIREAIQNCKVVTGVYHDKKRIIEPLGMIYGSKIYLIAREKEKGNDIYTYLLHKFETLEITSQIFDRNNFNLQEYTKLSFGVYHGEILNVKLSFSPELANEASKYNFHPTQKIRNEKDGSLTVSFKASGSKEIIWHVFKWGVGCKILAPKSLRNEYAKYLKENLDNY
jgi:predicted DNA-binding transcriptional regulator YafY